MWLAALALLVGEALIAAGLWVVYPPAALVVLGIQITLVGLYRSDL